MYEEKERVNSCLKRLGEEGREGAMDGSVWVDVCIHVYMLGAVRRLMKM